MLEVFSATHMSPRKTIEIIFSPGRKKLLCFFDSLGKDLNIKAFLWRAVVLREFRPCHCRWQMKAEQQSMQPPKTKPASTVFILDPRQGVQETLFSPEEKVPGFF